VIRSASSPAVTSRPVGVALPRAAAAAGAALLAFAAALLVRMIFIDRSWDVFIDELTYLTISSNLLNGSGLSEFGRPFFLHPPVYFALEAAYMRLFVPAGDLLTQLHLVRDLNAVLGAASAALIFQLVRRVAGWRAGAIAAVLFALDPFVIRNNSRNLLDTAAMFFVLAGYAVLLDGLDVRPPSFLRAVASGLLFGAAVLTKDMTAMLTVAPIGVLAITGWLLPRRKAAVVVCLIAATYATYVLGVAASGHWGDLVSQKFVGLTRFAGFLKETGFRSGGPSFIQAIVTNLDMFAATYVLFALGVAVLPLVMLHRDKRYRIVALWTLSAYAVIGFSVAVGTLEEQFFYFLIAPVIVTLGLGCQRLLDQAARGHLALAAQLIRPILLAFVIWSSAVWLEVHLIPDDGYARLGTYLNEHVSRSSLVGVVSDPHLTSSALLVSELNPRYRVEPVSTADDVCRTTAEYIVVSSKQVESGYVPDGPHLYSWIVGAGNRTFSFSGRSFGRLELYRIDPQVCRAPR
jgi:4-amino-4-deoxy-L-arabinose transferase-like glycosyltransferase